MNTVTSNDRTTIAFGRFGHGQPVIVGGGVVCDWQTTTSASSPDAR